MSRWSERYRYARNLLDNLALGETRKRVTDEEFGVLVAWMMDPPREPYSKASVSQWKYEQQEPPQKTVRAIAKLCGVDPGWLYFGDASSAHGPIGWKERPADITVCSPTPETARQLLGLVDHARAAGLDALPPFTVLPRQKRGRGKAKAKAAELPEDGKKARRRRKAS